MNNDEYIDIRAVNHDPSPRILYSLRGRGLGHLKAKRGSGFFTDWGPKYFSCDQTWRGQKGILSRRVHQVLARTQMLMPCEKVKLCCCYPIQTLSGPNSAKNRDNQSAKENKTAKKYPVFGGGVWVSRRIEISTTVCIRKDGSIDSGVFPPSHPMFIATSPMSMTSLFC